MYLSANDVFSSVLSENNTDYLAVALSLQNHYDMHRVYQIISCLSLHKYVLVDGRN